METLYPKTESQANNYQSLIDIIPLYLDASDPLDTNLANFVALVKYYTDGLNWCGLYLSKGETLYLGSFQGLPACTRIEKGKGVCGTAFLNKESVLVEDVHQFEGHITCDDASESELVIPIIVNQEVFGVLDLDAPRKARFSITDQKALEKAVQVFIDTCF